MKAAYPRLALFRWALAALASALITSAAEFTPVDPAAAAAIEQAVLATNVEMIAAANQLDVDRFFTHIADTNGTIIVQDGVIYRTRAEAYAAVKRGLQGVRKLDRRIDHPRVTVISADAALLVGDGTVAATFEDGRSMTTHFAVSLVFVRTGDRWQLLHGHYSMPDRR